MFNRSQFNSTRFNQPDEMLSLSSELSATAESYADPTVHIQLELNLSAESGLRFFVVSAARLSVEAAVSVNLFRLSLQKASLSGKASLRGNLSHYRINEISYSGILPPNGIAEINSKEMTFTIDGQNAIPLMEGDFLLLPLGMNQLVYVDGEITRSVLLQVINQELTV
ncbi:hypothetical protein ACX1C1_21420 [Paenibacillus sp. strain BS8-2]